MSWYSWSEIESFLFDPFLFFLWCFFYLTTFLFVRPPFRLRVLYFCFYIFLIRRFLYIRLSLFHLRRHIYDTSTMLVLPEYSISGVWYGFVIVYPGKLAEPFAAFSSLKFFWVLVLILLMSGNLHFPLPMHLL